LTLLLVDDNEGVRVTLAAILEDEGFVVLAVGSCVEARKSLETKGISLRGALLDVHLPDGLGTDLVPLVRALHPGAKVMLLSGSDEIGAHACGADAELSKGGDFEELIVKIRSIVGA